MQKLSEKEYWDNTYSEEHEDSIVLEGFRNRSSKEIFDSICKIDMADKAVLEVGAGDSQWLPFLAKAFPSSCFAGLDYSEIGCERLVAKAKNTNLEIEVIHADFLESPDQHHGRFDVLLSFGVVEHFDPLDKTLAAFQKFLKPGGTMYTIIPNMHGVIGTLTRKMNKDVYDIHNPHSLESLVKGHMDAGFTIVEGKYLCSNNFSVLSSCVDLTKDSSDSQLKQSFYRLLSRITSALWLFESRAFALPATSVFSPYIYCISRKPV